MLSLKWLQEGKPLVLNVVRKAEQQLINDRFSHLSFGFTFASTLYICVCVLDDVESCFVC